MKEKTNQMKDKLHARLKNVGTQMWTIFEQLMIQRNFHVHETNIEDSGGISGISTGFSSSTTIGHVDLNELGKVQAKYSKLDALGLMVQISRGGSWK